MDRFYHECLPVNPPEEGSRDVFALPSDILHFYCLYHYKLMANYLQPHWVTKVRDSMKYTVVLLADIEKGYTAVVPALPGCMSEAIQ